MSQEVEAGVEAEIRGYLLREVLEDPEAELAADTPLISGLLDSFDLMQLLSFLEERFEITIANREVVKGNFGSLASLARFVEGKQRGEA